jgi:homoserine dehydrogenase
MAGRTVEIALLGCGIVGGGVAATLLRQRKLLLQRTGVDFKLRYIADLDTRKHHVEGFASLPFTTDAAAAIDDPKTNVVVELIGGTGVAATFIERALRLGKPVVTANKSLLAQRGPELFALARKHHASIGFEASCCGGIPIINALVHGLVANRIEALVGIVNGTCNFILTQMTQQGVSYAQALAEAQKAGFAEADPTLDVSGRDSAQKLAILASLAFNARVAEKDIYLDGIDSLQAEDLKFAGELGYVIKLLAIAQREGKEKVSLRVHPTLVRHDDLLADVGGSFNAMSVYGSGVGHTLFYGRGAGRTPTASAVVSDIVQIGLGLAGSAFEQFKLLSGPPCPVQPFKELSSRYYLRLMAKDEPGVLAQVTKILGAHRISLSAVLQRETGESKFVPVVITTHIAREGDVQSALGKINRLKALHPPAVCLRIIDPPKEFAFGA